ncbi:tetratricopeptide repeat protein [Kitasatospora sp. NPDC001664]
MTDTAFTPEALPDDLAAVHRAVALIPAAEIDAHGAAAVTQATPAAARQQLAELARHQLLASEGRAPVRGDLYRVRRVVRDQPPARAGSEEEAAHRVAVRYLDHLVATAQEAGRRLTPYHRPLPHALGAELATTVRLRSRLSALQWLDGVQPSLPYALDAAQRFGEYQRLTVLVHDLWPLFEYRRPIELWITTHHMALRAARLWGSLAARRAVATALARGLSAAGRHEEADEQVQEVLKGTVADNDLRAFADVRLALVERFHAEGRYDLAQPFIDQAISLYRDLDDPHSIAVSLTLLGSNNTRLGRPGEGVELLTRARAVLQALPVADPLAAATALAHLGEAHSLAGSHDLATAALLRALEEFAFAGHQHWQARTAELLGDTFARMRLADAAHDWYTSGASQYQALGAAHDADRLREAISGLDRALGQTRAAPGILLPGSDRHGLTLVSSPEDR